LLGKEKDALIGQNFKNYIFPDEKKNFKDFLTRVFGDNSKITCELKMNAQEPKEVYVYIEGIVLSDDECLIAVFDVTERRRYEKTLCENEIRLKELNDTKDKFFSIIAHDLKGPFTSIIGFTEILLDQIKNKNFENLERFTNIVHNSSVQAMYLLSNLLEWAMLQTGKLKFTPGYVEVNSLLERIIILLSSSIQQKSIVVLNNLNREYIIFADQDMLGNIFRNIISNAIKFTPVGGTIKIEAEELTDAILFTISDTGVGITSDDIKKLFRIDTNYSTKGTQKEDGTGLGLLLCQEFIDKHGGRIWVESEPGMGSKFFFTIPAKQINIFESVSPPFA
jgi:signal transduction histidine kinase